MSVEHEACTVIGFFVNKDKFLAPLKKGDEWVLKGEEYDDPYVLLDELEKLVDADIRCFGDAFSGDEFGVAIEPMGIKQIDGSFSFEEIAKQEVKCFQLKEALKKLGLDPGDAGVFSILDIY